MIIIDLKLEGPCLQNECRAESVYRHTGDKIFWKDFERALHGLKGERQEPGVMPVSMNPIPFTQALHTLPEKGRSPL